MAAAATLTLIGKCSYTAVTCDPDQFEKEKFFLRQNIYGRSTELLICITMYNVRHFYSTATGSD